MDYTKGSIKIPQQQIEALAQCLLPEIQKFYESEEGKKEFAEWKKKQSKECKKIETTAN
jgi:hypothetical protein